MLHLLEQTTHIKNVEKLMRTPSTLLSVLISTGINMKYSKKLPGGLRKIRKHSGKRSCWCKWKTTFFFLNLCPNILLCSSQEQEHKDLPAAKEAMSVFKALFKSEIRHEDHPFHKAWFLVMLTILSRADFAQCKLWLHSFAWKNSTVFQSADQGEGYTNGKVYGELRTSLAK